VPTILYGIVPWPNFPVAPGDRQMVNQATGAVHYYAAFIFAALILGHSAAAWKHHLYNRDDIILRMAPRFLHPLLQRLRGIKA
jgi:cytochrome b561